MATATLLTETGEFEFEVDAEDGLCLGADDLWRATGWHMESEGLCSGDACVPAHGLMRGERIDAAAFWRRLGHPVVSDDAGGVWVLGTGAGARRDAMAALQAPAIVLPGLDGTPHALSALRGKKVLLTTWAPWCGCRTDLAVWQQLFDELKDEAFMVVAVAQESGGAERVRPWVEAAQAAYWCLVDEQHRLSDLLGLVNVPQATWIDEQGRIVRPPENPGWTDEWRYNAPALLAMSAAERRAHGFMSPEQRARRDASRLSYAAAVRRWVRTGAFALSPDDALRHMPPASEGMAEAHARFRLGLWLRARDRAAEARRQLDAASRLHPDSWTIWRQAAELEETGRGGGIEFLQRLGEQGERRYYPKPDLPGFD